MMKKIILVCTLFLSCLAYGQLDLPELSAFVEVPNSPEAAAFTKYGNVPVSYYTGKPEVSVPIYTISGREISVPISLSYDASGIKVQSISSSVGAGWNLNVGGMVTREVHGMADSAAGTYDVNLGSVRSMNSYLNSLRHPTHGYYLNFEAYEHTLARINSFRNLKNLHSLGAADLLPDIYRFRAPGLSGAVVIDPSSKEAVSIDDPDLRVTYAASRKRITTWTIINATGTTYYFARAEETTTSNSNTNEGTGVYNSAWYLTRMVSANAKDTFEFSYSNGIYWDQPQNYYNGETRRADLWDCGATLSYDPRNHELTRFANASDFKIKQSTLQRIFHNNKDIATFFYGTERQDLKGRNKLDQIRISDDTQVIKTFDFKHSYFTSGTSAKKETDYRLKLDAIEIKGHQLIGGISVILDDQETQKYAFHYNGTTFPSRTSMAMDALGYYNKKNNNKTLIPAYTDPTSGWVFSGADRDSDFDAMKQGLLTEIEYPTGGSTSFGFEKVLLSSKTVGTLETKSNGIGNIGSGADPTADENDFPCDDAFWYFPRTSTTSFTVNSDEVYNGNTSRYTLVGNDTSNPQTGEPTQGGRVFFMAIYKDTSVPSAPVVRDFIRLDNGCIQINEYPDHGPLVLCPDECELVLLDYGGEPFPLTICYNRYMGISDTSNEKTFCDIKKMMDSGDDDLVYYTHAPTQSSYELIFDDNLLKYWLPAGNYKVFMANSLDGISFSLSRTYQKRVFKVKKEYTSRLNTITDKTNQGEAYTKKLEYLEHSRKQYSQLHTITTTVDNNNAACFTNGKGSYTTLTRHTNNQYSTAPYQVAYPKVRETVVDASGNPLGSTIYDFYDQEFYILNSGTPYSNGIGYNPKIGQPYIQNNPLNGQLQQVSHYDQTGRVLKTQTSIYGFESDVVTSGTTFYNSQNMLETCTMAFPGEINPSLKRLVYLSSSNPPGKVCSSSGGNNALGGWSNETPYSDITIQYQSFKTRLLENQTKDYYYDPTNQPDSIVQQVTYSYGTHHNMPIEVTTSVDNDNTMVTTTKYPEDLDNPSAIEQQLIANNQVAIPIEATATKKDAQGTILATQRQYTEYKQWSPDVILPKTISTAIDNQALDLRLEYHAYEQGNPIEVSKANGAHMVYIWGYDHTYPIAKISNASYGGMPVAVTTLIDQLQTASDIENTTAREQNMRALVDTLRAHPYFINSEITSFTYDPLVGVTSQTDPRGYTMYYQYDEFNRLVYVRDAEGNLVSKNKYDYKN